jgi:hypothetical protein
MKTLNIKAILIAITLVLFVLMATAFLGGCGTGYTAINGKDTDVFFPTLRLNHPLTESSRKFGPGESALEVDLSHGRGSSHQALSAGEMISLNGTIFSGPGDVQQRFNLDVASAVFRIRTPGVEPVYADLLFGTLYTGLDLDLLSGGQTAHKEMRDGGGVLGIGIGSYLIDRLTVDARFVFEVLPFNWTRQSNMQSLDLQVSYWLMKQAAVTGGYRRWKYRVDTDGSDVNALVWQGFSAGLTFSF